MLTWPGAAGHVRLVRRSGVEPRARPGVIGEGSARARTAEQGLAVVADDLGPIGVMLAVRAATPRTVLTRQRADAGRSGSGRAFPPP